VVCSGMFFRLADSCDPIVGMAEVALSLVLGNGVWLRGCKGWKG
jgi:hypothetical protein